MDKENVNPDSDSEDLKQLKRKKLNKCNPSKGSKQLLQKMKKDLLPRDTFPKPQSEVLLGLLKFLPNRDVVEKVK